MRQMLIVVALTLAATIQLHAQRKPAKPEHFIVRVASGAESLVVHPKRTVKQALGVVLGGIETGVDVSRLVLEGTAKVLETANNSGVVPFLYPVYYVVDKAADYAAKADVGLEQVEMALLGTHN